MAAALSFGYVRGRIGGTPQNTSPSHHATT
jgi:hypothetical protein